MLTERQLFFEKLAQTSDAPLAIEIEKASGCRLYSPDGKVYLDLIAGISVSNLGHNNPEIIKAAKDQMDRHMHLMVYGEFIQKPQVQLADMLTELLPPGLKSVFFTNSGSEAVEGAIKLSRRYTGRHEIICFKNAYHGSTTGALSVMGNETLKRPFRPLLPSVVQLEFNNESGIGEISSETACVLVEPIQTEAGVMVADPGFLLKLRQRCSETGTLLVFDEIQTGFGRTGSLFAMDSYGIYPDIVLFAKSFGGGLPLGAFVSSPEIMKCLGHHPALGHITTFGGHPVSCAAGLASLRYIHTHRISERVERAGENFRNLLDHPLIVSLRGKGLLMAMDLGDPGIVRKLIAGCLQKGMITDWFLFNDRSVRISPPLIIGDEEIEEACRIITSTLDEIRVS